MFNKAVYDVQELVHFIAGIVNIASYPDIRPTNGKQEIAINTEESSTRNIPGFTGAGYCEPGNVYK